MIAYSGLCNYIYPVSCFRKRFYSMKRRAFILKIIAATSVISLPAFYYTCRSSSHYDPLITPEILSRFCDGEVIRTIGEHYLFKFPSEAQKEKLVSMILTGSNGEKLKSSDHSEIRDWVERKINEDFKQERILIIDGWIISATEARQCALYSFAQK